MTDFLITSNTALIILLAVYHLWLEREKMHTFNRFYLLGALLLSLAIPFLAFEIIREVPATVAPEMAQSIPAVPFTEDAKPAFPFHLVFWIFYSIVTIAFLIRFLRNVGKFISLEKDSEVIDFGTSKIILLKKEIQPHTFWNRIYVNASDYHSGKTSIELLEHELVHVKQKHSTDIIFIEFLKTIFWFNPIFILYKRAIQLNHEFLADTAVVKKFDVAKYQNLLLTNASAHSYPLASTLTFQLTKKRLLMMTKSKSNRTILLKKISLLPILALLIYFNCVEVVAQENPAVTKGKNVVGASQKNPINGAEDPRDSYFKGVHIIVRNSDHNQIIIDNAYELLSSTEKDLYLPALPAPYTKKTVSPELFTSYKNSQEFAIWIDGKHTSNNALNNHNATDFALATQSFIHKNARSKKFYQPNQVQLYTHNYFENNLKNLHRKYQGDTLKVFYTSKIEKEKIERMNAIVEKNKHIIAQKVLEDGIEEDTEETQTDVRNVTDIDKKPEFPGGISEFFKFVSQNYKAPTSFSGRGRVIVMFIVEKDGSLSNIDVMRDAGEGTGQEAIRVLQLSPKWIPGEDKGELVRVRYSLPISIVK